MLKIFFFTLIFIVFIIGSLALICILHYRELGSRPNKTAKKKFQLADNYNPKKKRFENRIPDIMKKIGKRFKEDFSWQEVYQWFFSSNGTKPKKKLPEVKPDVKEFLKPTSSLKVIWFGHSSLLLNIDGKIILVDPIFSSAVSPIKVFARRFQKPVIKMQELPPIDYILISHDHYDHLDLKTMKFFIKQKKIKFITPLGVGGHLRGWGAKAQNIFEQGWEDTKQFKGIQFTAMPSQHSSGRSLFRRDDTLWASWVIKTQNHNVYFGSDSGFDIHFQEIGEKYGPFDIAFLDSGQYNPKWREVHMSPEEAVVAFKEVKAKKFFPIHWGMFSLALHNWDEPAEKLFQLAEKEKLPIIMPKIGEIVDFKKETPLTRWWASAS